MTADSRIGEVIAGCRIESEIGRGGMGVVYLAEHLHLGRKVALKLLPPEFARSERFRERFVRESRLAATIDHPNVIPVYDAGEANGQLYISMRYVDGEDLGSLIRREAPLGPELAIGVIELVAAALDAAHAETLVHRDVKPGNVLIGNDGHVYLTDFGLTKRSDSRTAITGTGLAVGTVAYMAPEQFEGGEVDTESDVYSLGCVLYECISGRAPFVRDTEAATMYAHFNEPPPRLSGSTPGVPSAMDAVVARALAKQRHDRFASCGELARAARAALTAPVAHAEYATATAKAPPSRTAPRQRGVPRRLRWVVGVVALAAAGAAATLLFPRSGGVQGGVATATYQQTDHKLFRVALRRGADPENVGRSLESRSKGADDWINISADGRSLLLSTERFGCAGYACIVLADHGLRNPEVVRVDGEAQHARFGAVSSRTNLIVTESTDGPHVTDLWTLRRSGRSWSKPVLLTSASPHKWNAFPALTGDAGRVAFECGPDPSESLDSSICEVGTDGSGLRVLLTPARRPPGVEAGSYALTHPSYGPRGELFFESDWGTPGDQVWRLPAGSHDPVRITTEGHHYAPCVLSDGRVVALRSTQSGGTDEHEIVVMRADGSKPVVIATVSGVLETVLGCSG